MSLSARLIKLAIAFAVPLLVLLLPTSVLPLPELTLIQHRILAIFLLAALLWVLEPVPVFATSLLIISLELILISDQGLVLFMHDSADGTPLGTPLSYSSIFASFASPIIILFLGGFALAIAAAKYQLDINLARVLLKPFGTKVEHVMLGLMLITAVFSMFMSNTATTVMMLAIMAPLLALAPKGDPGIKALVLCIPIAANMGGIGTPIGTPPNAIALQYLPSGSVTFAQWMMIGIPFVLLQLTVGWWMLKKLYPAQQPHLTLNIQGKFQTSGRAILVYVTFASTILLWLTTQWHGMNSYVVAILPLAIFTLTGVMTKEDLKLINWDVLWLVAGGIAMGLALDKSGLAKKLAESIPFSSMSLIFVMIALSLVCFVMANFMSNTATANLIMPIAAAVATTLPGLGADGVKSIILVVAFSASIGMMLPVSTPPNSLAYSTGLVNTNDLLKVGAIIGSVGLAVLWGVASLLF